MSKIKLLSVFAIFAILFATSCAEENESEVSQGDSASSQLADEQNATEENKIPTTILETGVLINGAEKNVGTPPAPNSELDFQISTNQNEAFQKEGFNIKFSSDDNIAGAYLLFKDVDGNKSDSFFDVPSSSFVNSASSSGRHSNQKRIASFVKNASNQKGTEQGEDLEISVDFDETVPAGEFCYGICVYDAEGNISQVEQGCVTVEAWGGNSNIVGEWVRENRPSTESETYSETCVDGTLITADYEINIEKDYFIVFNDDGTYYELYDEGYSSIDTASLYSNCDVTYNNYRDKYRYDGNWSYNEDDETLTVIDYSYTDLLDPSLNQTYVEGDVYFDAVSVTIIDNKMTISGGFGWVNFIRK